jgi:hypothetical protein
LRTFRVVNGYATARAFSQALGIDENRYTRYERAESEPDITLLTQMARLLGVALSDLLEDPPGGEGETGSAGPAAVDRRPRRGASAAAPGLRETGAGYRPGAQQAGAIGDISRAYLLSLVEQRVAELPQGEVDGLIRALIEQPRGRLAVLSRE